MSKIKYLTLILICIPVILFAQKAEEQVSFARITKPHTYYVEQAELWWHEVENDKTSEDNWYNYFRACRNAHGTADWSSDFIKESPYLKTGDSILSLIKQHIPNTFTHYYLSYLKNGIGTGNGEDILKAYEMNPDFEGIHSSVVSYAESSLDRTLRKQVNKEWHKTNYLSSQLMTYAYNALMSLDSNAVIFVQHDNDTYPMWMLQDALGIRSDVTVISIDFLLLDAYRISTYKALNVPELSLGTIDLDEYHSNWRKVLTHVLKNHKADYPVYLSMTVAAELYEGFEQQLYVSGLAFRFSKNKLDTSLINKKLYEEKFMLDYLSQTLSYDMNQTNVDYQNLNYLNCFENVYKQYKSLDRHDDAKKIKDLSLTLVNRLNRKEYTDWVNSTFN